MADSDLSPQQLEEIARRLEAESRRLVWSGTEWLDGSAIAARSLRPVCDVEVQLEGWVRQRHLFSIERDGRAVYPLYALAQDFTPLPVVSGAMAILSRYGNEALASWFESTSAFLRGARPRELVRVQPNLVLAAAKDTSEAEEYCG